MLIIPGQTQSSIYHLGNFFFNPPMKEKKLLFFSPMLIVIRGLT